MVWVHLADFLLWQECRTLIMQSDLLSYHQPFMALFFSPFFFPFFFLIYNLLLAGSAERCFVACSAQGDVKEEICRSSWTQHLLGEQAWVSS